MKRAVSLDLVLVGFGHVARRFARLLLEQAPRLERDHALTAKVVGIATRTHGIAANVSGLDVAAALALADSGQSLDALSSADRGVAAPTSPVELINRMAAKAETHAPGRLVVCETTVLDINGGQPAIEHVDTALRNGAHVITANKGPAAFAYRELETLARAVNRAFLFEGAVMDGVPIFNLLRETMPAVDVLGFRAVLNATTNHILTAMEGGREFDDALSEMQAAGITEADPSVDVDGWDAAAKTAALMNVAMGAHVTPQDIERRGIRETTAAGVRSAMQRNRRIRLVASAERRDDGVVGRVGPIELPAADPLAQLQGMENAIFLRTDLLGEVGIFQRDSGLLQTAYALLSDLVAVRRRL